MGLSATLYRHRWRIFVFLVLTYAFAITVYILPTGKFNKDLPAVPGK